MDVYYHITLKSNLPSILNKGLLPRSGNNTSPSDMGCGWSLEDYHKCLTAEGMPYHQFVLQQKANWESTKKQKIKRGVYLARHTGTCTYMAGAMKKLRDNELVLLEITTCGLDVKHITPDPDDTNGDSICYTKKIAPEHIKVIHTGNLRTICASLRGEEVCVPTISRYSIRKARKQQMNERLAEASRRLGI